MGNNLLDRAKQSSLLLQDHQQPLVNHGDDAETGIASMQAQFAALMPSDDESARRITADAIQLVRKTPKLKQCDPNSVLGGLVTCAQLDLRPGVGGEAWLIPMWNRNGNGGRGGFEATLVIGYQGLVTLARRSDLLGDVQVIRIYDNDRFEFSWDYDRLVHEPNWRDPGEVIGWYAVVKLTNGLTRVERPWTVRDMEIHRDLYAMARKKGGEVVGPWRDNFNAMADKTMMIRALKTAPKSYSLQAGLWSDGGVRRNTDRDADVFEVTHTRDEIKNLIEAPEAVEGEVEPDAETAETVDVEPAR